MTLGVFVEGQSDRRTIPVLIRKVGYDAGIRVRVVRQGDMLNLGEMSAQVTTLISTQSRLNRVLVFTDSEGVDPDETLRSTESIATRLSQVRAHVPVSYIVVDHSIEGWLACDIGALRAVLGANARIRISGNPEDHPRPARLMAQIFRANGQDFKKTVHNPKIAEHVTPRNISEKSPTFRRLVAVLRGGRA